MLTTAYAIGTTTAIFPGKGIHGTCIDCGKKVISKYGTVVTHHFAHAVESDCGSQFHDHKSEWHQAWQHTVSPAIAGVNVEVTIIKDKTVKRADLISHAKYIIEFQHSHLSLPERVERETHYQNIIWVVHTDRKNSKTWRTQQVSRNRIFFNGNNDEISWKNRYSISKQKFIDLVINNERYCDYIISTIEERQDRIKERGYDHLNTVVAFHWLNRQYHIIDDYIKQSAYVRYLREIQRHKEEESEKTELLKIKNPAFLQTLIRTQREMQSESIVSNKLKWVNLVESNLITLNKTIRIKQELRLKRKQKDGFPTYCFWLYFNEKLFPVIQREPLTTIDFIDTTPIPQIPRSARRSVMAKKREINRGKH